MIYSERIKNMTKLTTEKYKCADCGKLRNLVIIRGQASRCLECHSEHKLKLAVIREVNKMLR